MIPLALALNLAAAAPSLAPTPPLDPGPFRGGELAMASVGAAAGDALVLGAGYLTLQLFAKDAISPTAANFRRAAYVMAGAALLVPPLTSVLLARWTGGSAGAGSFWKAMLLATAGQVAALSAGYLAAPHVWVVFPVQLATVAAGTSLGLHWGRRPAPAGPAARPAPHAPASERETDADADAPASVALFVPVCPDA